MQQTTTSPKNNSSPGLSELINTPAPVYIITHAFRKSKIIKIVGKFFIQTGTICRQGEYCKENTGNIYSMEAMIC